MSKLLHKLEKLPTDIERLKVSVNDLMHPNHRHDDPAERRNDQIRTEIAKSHRFESFAKQREGNHVKWYIDGHDYFWAVSELIESARECICIFDWWLTPELYLRRPPAKHEDYRLDRLLLRKAEQGVKVYVVVYKEVTATMTMSSAHTKHSLEALHPNIACMRHPDHLGGEVTLYWSHHEKVVIVDNVKACIGGLDLCFGRWDTHNFPLSDANIFDFSNTLFPGQDYNNARIMDFQHVDKWTSNQLSRLDSPRMPWHDVHMMMMGPVVLDIAQHFVERWNFVKGQKYKDNARYDWLAFPHVAPDSPSQQAEEPVMRHPHWNKFRDMGRYYGLHGLFPEEGGIDPDGGPGRKGDMNVQVCRSSADWSSGILTEHSIQNAYIELIGKANHFIYIENQFFISNTTPGQGPVKNRIAEALVAKILEAAREGRKFKVIVVVPAVPGFAGDVKGQAGLLAIMDYTYKTICRGGHSIMELVAKAGYDPNEYISFYNLRSYDRINSSPMWVTKMEQESGVTFFRAQAALTKLYIGDNPTPLDSDLKTVNFKKPQEGEAINVKQKDQEGQTIAVDLPGSVDEALSMIHKWEGTAPPQYQRPKGSIAQHALQSGGSVWDEGWGGDEASERDAYVTEELYIHTKLMIVDDRRVIMGSANLNDRSQDGDHDSEIACVVEDQEMVESQMNGRRYMAARFATSLRRQIFREHLGLIKPQNCPANENPTDAMNPVGTPQGYDWGSQEDQMVMDPMSEDFFQLWNSTAKNNAEAFGRVFHCVPSKEVEDWKSYSTYLPQPPILVGHVATKDMPLNYIKENLASIRGHLVEMPLNFLKNEKLFELGPSVNEITLPIYL